MRPANWWGWLRLFVGVAIVGSLGWHLTRLVSHPDVQFSGTVAWPHVLLCGGLYAVGMTMWAVYWAYLVRQYEPDLPWRKLVIVYWISQLGKYVPGKAVVVVVRAGARNDCPVPFAVAMMTCVYETLTVMACGAILALPVVDQVLRDEFQTNIRWEWLLIGMVGGLLVLPKLFEDVGRRLARRLLPAGAPPLRSLRYTSFFVGIVLSVAGWWAMGWALLALLSALPPPSVEASVSNGNTVTTWIALAYVGGFAALPAPAGLGVREALLQKELALLLLLPAASAARAAIMLRLIWTVVDIVLAGMLWLWSVARRKR